jgi:hypothetical protein
MNTKKIYKIFDKQNNRYLTLGYRPKSSWFVFPSEAIKTNGLDQQPDRFEVDMFEMKLTQSLNTLGEEIACERKNSSQSIFQ